MSFSSWIAPTLVGVFGPPMVYDYIDECQQRQEYIRRGYPPQREGPGDGNTGESSTYVYVGKVKPCLIHKFFQSVESKKVQ